MRQRCPACKRPLPKKRANSIHRGYVDGVKTYPDGRQIVRDWVMRLRLELVWQRDCGLCGICGKFVPLEEAVPDHINPRGIGSSRRDDRTRNLQPAHAPCNVKKGSKRNYRP